MTYIECTFFSLHLLTSNSLTAKILTGSHAGNTVLLCRIALTSDSNADLPFTLRRVQFPIRLAFGMTINKSQGQSYDYLGLYLKTPVFSHGQLYVGLSRPTSIGGLRILLNDTPSGRKNQTLNVTYHEIFQPEPNLISMF
jgi:ATP-dependent DNA helicase PIF1